MYFYLPDWPKLAKNQGFLKIGLFEKEALEHSTQSFLPRAPNRTDPSTQARDTFTVYDGPRGDPGGIQPFGSVALWILERDDRGGTSYGIPLLVIATLRGQFPLY